MKYGWAVVASCMYIVGTLTGKFISDRVYKKLVVLDSTYNVGDKRAFVDNSDKYVISKSDKENVYFVNGDYYIESDETIMKKQESGVVSMDTTVLQYLRSIKDFNQTQATIMCIDMTGQEVMYDLSTPWEDCDFQSLTAYWKEDDSKGMLVSLMPKNPVIVMEYLYYTDLLDDLGVIEETTNNESSNSDDESLNSDDNLLTTDNESLNSDSESTTVNEELLDSDNESSNSDNELSNSDSESMIVNEELLDSDYESSNDDVESLNNNSESTTIDEESSSFKDDSGIDSIASNNIISD